mmetsp:Transcript_10799/g.15012  ORF Transcript_10799/g.15012 Transcript_10799/m.15012 type:complete len:286 (-) Transcript_10799:300-1157(-)
MAGQLLLVTFAALPAFGNLRTNIEANIPSLNDGSSEYDFVMDNLGEGEDFLTQEDILEDIELSKKNQALSNSVWEELDEDLYKNYVLPFRVATERPSKWRAQFHERFWPQVKGMSKAEAVKHLNKEAFSYLGVSYKKEYEGHKPDQNPFESQNLHYASCTGLSIILVCACRSVGIPARLVMTPAWVTSSDPGDCKSGLSGADENHSWVEVNIDGRWHYIGASEESELDKTWFTEQAGRARPATETDWKHSIYAVEFSKTNLWKVPAPWDTSKSVQVVEVVHRYKK